ncbi:MULTISPECIES: chorismate mutase [Georgenia]|uniref:Chorismate mutase n=1 Tax=Georgenia muralis TaxID=154117 RepID=A0A3N4Z959_9MICO|nr:chorismate mutase [Georgenia muralis]RPF27770.1 chorismate mutase [Georgenia muralis]
MTRPGIHASPEPDEVPAELRAARGTIDNIDAALVHLLAERFRCTQQVGVLKARLSLPPSDPAREQRQVARLRALAEEAGLDPVFAEKFLAFIVEEVIRHHTVIADTIATGGDVAGAVPGSVGPGA